MRCLEVALRSVAVLRADGEPEHVRLLPDHELPPTHTWGDGLGEEDTLRRIPRLRRVDQQHLCEGGLVSGSVWVEVWLLLELLLRTLWRGLLLTRSNEKSMHMALRSRSDRR